MLKETYRKIESLLGILKESLTIENNEEKLEFNERQKKFFETEPFKSYDKIFDYLEKGQISKERFDAYQEIKSDYEMLIHLAFESGEFKSLEEFYYNETFEELKKRKRNH